MTIKQARKILGKSVDNLSDEKLQEHIDVVAMIAEISFMKYKEYRHKNDKQIIQNA